MDMWLNGKVGWHKMISEVGWHRLGEPRGTLLFQIEAAVFMESSLLEFRF